MIDASVSVVESPKPSRTRAPRKPADQSPRKPADRIPKSRDDSMGKASFYLPADLLKKLVVAAVIRGVDQSDIVAELLKRELSSVTFYDRSTRPADSTLLVTGIDRDAAA